MIKRATDYLVEQFKELGFKVMRYDSYSSKSVYLKLDDGVVGTLRISDHKGKKHLRYKYNLTKGSYRYKRDDKGVVRYYFPMQDINLLVEKVVYDRKVLIDKYGQDQYAKFMVNNRNKGRGSKGFWTQAKYV
ncbi:hypothetical protein [Sporosarcina sp. FSL K6-5500]|uniref:hypothetical protein n=1 Tax=Sporosarcina sp. FSL K6-5500 TaxID=2921558 RepID=UPI0030FA9B60